MLFINIYFVLSSESILFFHFIPDKNMKDIRRIFFELKDTVFKGSRPYNSEVFETLLKREFGDMKLMPARDKVVPLKLIIPAALANKLPPQIHLFRNYCWGNESNRSQPMSECPIKGKLSEQKASGREHTHYCLNYYRKFHWNT